MSSVRSPSSRRCSANALPQRWPRRRSTVTASRLVYDGVHVRDAYFVTAKGKPVLLPGNSVYSFDGKGLEFTYVNSMGGVGHGTANVQSGVMSYNLSMKAKPAGAPRQFRGKWTVDADGYDVANDGQPPHRFSLSR